MAVGTQFEFRDGALFLAGPGMGELRLQWHPVPTAERRLSTGKWSPYQPEFRLLAPMAPISPDVISPDAQRLEAKHEAFQALRATIPEDVVNAVEPFTCYQWPLMMMLHASDAARDLAKTNPVLAYALANNDQLRPGGRADVAAMQATRYSHRKQREILGWLGFPDTEAVVRVLKKMPPALAYPGLLRKLGQSVKDPDALKMMGHLSAINTGVIFLTASADLAAFATPKLLQEVASAREEALSAPTADQLLELLQMADQMHIRATIHPFTSRHKLEECYDRIVLRYRAFRDVVSRQNEVETKLRKVRTSVPLGKKPAGRTLHDITALTHEYARLEALRPGRPVAISERVQWSRDTTTLRRTPFPPPPIPGTDTIVPLTSFAALEEEANIQGNCLATNPMHAHLILDGTRYIYRVLAPERHTLSIMRLGAAGWRIAELRQRANAEGSKTTTIVVQHWLDANQISL